MAADLFKGWVDQRRNAFEWLALGLALLLSGMMMGYFIWTERRIIVSADIERMRMQTQIIDENLRHQLEGVRNALGSTRDALRDGGDCTLACRQVLLQSLKRAMPGVRALVVLDRDGKIRISDDDLRDARLDDRDYTRNIAAMRAPDTLYLSQPYENTPGVFNLKLSLAFVDGRGANDGVVSAILNPEYFDAVMRSALYAPDMNSAITEDSGRRILFVPADPAALLAGAIRAATPADPFFRRHRASGLRQTVLQGTVAGGERRLVVQRTMLAGELGLERPLVISVGRSQARIDAPWLALAWSYCALWTVFGAGGAMVLVVLQRRRRASEEVTLAREEERADAAERIDMALGGANLGLWDWHLPSGWRSVDTRTSAMLGLGAAEHQAAAQPWSEQVHPDDRHLLDAALAAHLRDASLPYEAEYRMRHRNGHWVWLQSRGKVVQRGAGGAPLRMVGTCMDVSARKLAEEKIAHLAFYDGLTNLPNRRLLLDRLGHAVAKCERAGSHGAVMFVDLDNFKSLNDTMGHDVGDRLLEMVAFRLQQVTRDTDTVARLGGDEFVILLEDLGASLKDAAAHAEMVVGKVLGVLGLCYPLDGHDLRSTPSIGVVMFGARNQSVNDLLRQADMAMYEAKAAGRNTFRFFDPLMQAAVDETASLDADLRFALERRELRLYYQPVVDADARVSGFEALLRWRHPQRGLVLPGAFIGQAEKSGLIIEIGDWVLETACLQLVRWSASPRTAQLTIAVNVSARQFRQPEFAERVLEVLGRTGADPQLLKLELTESMLLADIDDVIAKMTLLKRRGVGFSLDDFGTGYSSLSYLRQLPIDQLKIDRSFVHDMLRTPHAAIIVRAIVTLAHSMGLEVVAEGVETQEQRSSLAAIGCGAFQGYLFGHAMPLRDVMAALASSSLVERKEPSHS